MALGGAREEAGRRFGAQEGTDAGPGAGARSLRSLDPRLPLWKGSCQGAGGPLREAELAGTREAGVPGRRGSGEGAQRAAWRGLEMGSAGGGVGTSRVLGSTHCGSGPAWGVRTSTTEIQNPPSPSPHRMVPGALGMSGLFLYLLVASAQGFHS